MFTGIIEELGTVGTMNRRPDSIRLTVLADKVLGGTNIGDSIAVNGVCLTVTDMSESFFSADVMHETMRRSSLKDIRSGSAVNLERAVQMGGRMGGHIVSGHIDGTGTVSRIVRDGIAQFIYIKTPPELIPYIVEKGSIAIDGISLTVAEVGGTEFSVSVIPHTMGNTTLPNRPVGACVNLETDIIGKYVRRFTEPYGGKKNTLTLSTLLENGF